MRKIGYLVLVSLFLAGCGSSFKSNFKDFNAYYNTYYNAKKSFNRGLEKSLDQARTYNTLQPIRVYETPRGAGGPDFDNAIEKGASVLRKYEDTKWVDNALEIIGKSYYFKNEYFNAIQKFDELYVNADNVELQQRSIYWKGRVLLELQAYNEGIQYLNEQLSINEGEWNSKLEWQVKTVLAEHYIATENWVNALDLLNQSIGKIPGRANNERGYFLIGQLNEILSDPESAFNAYDRVGKYYSNYDLQFAAKKKKAEVARDLGDIDEAISVFKDMVRDDKNTEFVSELNYELGKSEQLKGDFEEANKIFISILRDQVNKPSNKVRALTYNGLAELNRYEFDNYTLAAAYYDSSARLNIPLEELPEEYDARNLANSFGSYADITYQIYEQDSLLWLGTLSDEAFDSVLKEIEAQKLAELERLREEQEERRNTMVNVGGNDNSQEQQTSSENGFLNVRNPLLIAEASEQFKAVWGARPLVDNWRINALIVNSLIDDSTQVSNTGGLNAATSSTVDLSIDLSRIPFTPADQDSVLELISTLNYELGNLFFLQLDQPDSAGYYFKRVIEERPNGDVVPVTLYSLSELYDIQGDTQQSRLYAQQLIDNHPDTEFAQRLTSKFDIELPEGATYSEVNPRDIYLDTLDEQIPDSSKAEKLTELAISYQDESFSDKALFDAIKIYIRLGKEDSIFVNNYTTWVESKTEWNKTQNAFQQEKDSISVAFNDTSIIKTPSDSLLYVQISDSLLTTPDFKTNFPYYGAMWDSARSKIDLFSTTFNSSNLASRVRTLKVEFEVPVDELEKTDIIEESVISDENSADNSEYISCLDIDQAVQIRGGTDIVTSSIVLTDDVQDESITFLFFINQRGVIDEFKLASDSQNEELISVYVEAIDALVSFEPILINGESQKIQCEVEFEIPVN